MAAATAVFFGRVGLRHATPTWRAPPLPTTRSLRELLVRCETGRCSDIRAAPIFDRTCQIQEGLRGSSRQPRSDFIAGIACKPNMGSAFLRNPAGVLVIVNVGSEYIRVYPGSHQCEPYGGSGYPSEASESTHGTQLRNCVLPDAGALSCSGLIDWLCRFRYGVKYQEDSMGLGRVKTL